MTDGPIDQNGQGSAVERRLRHAPGQCIVARGHAALVSRVRPVRTSGIPVPRRSAKAPSTGRSFRGYSAHYTQASFEYGASFAGICEKQWADDRNDRDTRVGQVPEYSEKAWLSRVQDMARFKFTLTMRLIAGTTRSWPRPTVFWCLFGSAPSAAV